MCWRVVAWLCDLFTIFPNPSHGLFHTLMVGPSKLWVQSSSQKRSQEQNKTCPWECCYTIWRKLRLNERVGNCCRWKYVLVCITIMDCYYTLMTLVGNRHESIKSVIRVLEGAMILILNTATSYQKSVVQSAKHKPSNMYQLRQLHKRRTRYSENWHKNVRLLKSVCSGRGMCPNRKRRSVFTSSSSQRNVSGHLVCLVDLVVVVTASRKKGSSKNVGGTRCRLPPRPRARRFL